MFRRDVSPTHIQWTEECRDCHARGLKPVSMTVSLVKGRQLGGAGLVDVELFVRVGGQDLPPERENELQQAMPALIQTFAPGKRFERHGSWFHIKGQLPYGHVDTDESVVHQIFDSLRTDIILVRGHDVTFAGPTLKDLPREVITPQPTSETRQTSAASKTSVPSAVSAVAQGPRRGPDTFSPRKAKRKQSKSRRSSRIRSSNYSPKLEPVA